MSAVHDGSLPCILIMCQCFGIAVYQSTVSFLTFSLFDSAPNMFKTGQLQPLLRHPVTDQHARAVPRFSLVSLKVSTRRPRKAPFFTRGYHMIGSSSLQFISTERHRRGLANLWRPLPQAFIPTHEDLTIVRHD